jgi:GAF domain-containing protein/anti-sigma regulatory factor (Ser/Thr protein kinase)
MAVNSDTLLTPPNDDYNNRLTFAALLFAAIVIVTGFISYPASILSDPQGIFVFSVTYAALLLLAYRIKSGIYIGIGSIALVAALLSVGSSATLLIAILGVILAAIGRQLFYSRLALSRSTTKQEVTRASFTIGIAGLTIQIGALLCRVLGINLVDSPLMDEPPLFPLLILILFVAIGLIQTASLSLVFFGNRQFYKQEERLSIIWRVLLINTLPLPLGALLAVIYHSLPFVAFIVSVGGLIVGAVLYRLSEMSRHSLERRVAELGLITQFGQSLSQNLPMADLLDVFYQQIGALIPVDLLVIGLYSKASDTVSIIYARQGNQKLEWPPDRDHQGLFHYLGRNRKPILLRGDVERKLAALGISPLFPPIPACYLGIPLVVGDHLVGMISIEHLTDTKAYGESELSIIQMLAPQTAIALRNAELYSRLSGMTGELSELNDLSRSISTVLDLDRALNMICQAMITMIRADRTSILLCSEDDRFISIVASSGLSVDFLSQYQNIPIDTNNDLAQFMRAKKPAILADMKTDPHAIGWRSVAEVEGFQAMAIVPMYTGNRPLGALAVFYNQPHIITPEDLALLNTLANQVTAAVANARLFREVEQRAEDMARLVESSYALIESLDVPVIAQTLAERLAKLLALDLAAIYMPNRESNQMELMAVTGRLTAPSQLPNTPTLRALSRVLKNNLKLADSNSGYRLTDETLLREFGLQSALALPLTAHAASIGIAIMGSVSNRRFTRREWQMAEALLNQAATALDNAMLFQLVDSELEERIRQLLAIENVSRKLTMINSLSLGTVIDEVLKAALSVTYADMASCGLLDGRQIHFTVQARPHIHLIDQSNPVQGITGRVMRTGLPALVADVTTDPDYIPILPETRSELCVPILIHGASIGVLDLESIRENGFNTAHLSFLTTLADHTALAIEQARLFAEIRRRNEQMRAILDSTYSGMLLINADSRLMDANAAAERLLNRPLTQYIGQNSLRLLVDLSRDPQIISNKSDLEQWLSAKQQVLLRVHEALRQIKGDPKHEFRHHYQVQLDEATIDVDELTIPIRDDQDEVVARLVVLRDVTNEKNIQRFRDQMIDMVVHDLRSPLANVVTSLNMTTELMVHDDTKIVEQLLEIATQNTHKVIKQVESILELRKMESGQIELTQAPVALTVLVADAIRMLNATATSASVTITNQAANTLPLVNVDASQMTRVLVNLLDNALKYTPNNGQIRIETELSAESHFLQVRVVDTGPGIPITMRRQVFDLFVTVTSKAIRGRRGMGLGLTFCRLIVEAHGGTIWADAGPEGGAAMCFTLPIVESPKAIAGGQ